MLNVVELSELKRIEDTYYMSFVLKHLQDKIKKVGIANVLDYSYEILKESEVEIRKLQELRKEKGEINDISQALKSIAGSAFSNLVIYAFLLAKKESLVKDNIFITTNKQKFQNLVSINVDGETQKPDMDLIIYSEDNEEIKKIMIVSLKTSLRERAGQTYKWKLLLEIATTENEIKKKYNVKYEANKMPLVCFATVNFYNEINNPQHRGMFKFFDNSFIGKPLNSDFISNLSSIIEYANTKLI